nr:lysosome membrane protein 2-like isoform X3 [Dermatophagoides farinae]XP_046909606.1 lysosome membrane protein 2-like isoform X3 [Dermatophagoides farinae]
MGWLSPPISLYVHIYLFDIRNPQQYLDGARPNIKEIGPFIFRVGRKRRINEWTEQTVIFNEEFDADLMIDESYPVNITMNMINAPILCTVSWIYYWMKYYRIPFIEPIIQNVVAISLQVFGEHLVSETTPWEILFGRPVNILRFLDKILSPIKSLNLPLPDFGQMLSTFGNYKLTNHSFSIIGLLMSNEFGPLEHYRRNYGRFKTNEVRSILGQTEYENYKRPCSFIHGLDLMYFGIHAADSVNGSRLDLYFQHFCRSFPIIRQGFYWTHGIRIAHYEIWQKMFDMRQRENHCYCFNDRTLNECDGHVDMSGCFSGLPIALSFRHFYGSRILNRETLGFQPRWDEHGGHIDIEPTLGLPLEINLPFQYNIMTKNLPRFGQLSNIQSRLMPFFAFQVKAKLDGILFVGILIMAYVVNYLKYLFAIGALTLSLFCFFRFFY